MEDFKVYVYIILLVFYFIYQFLKKSKESKNSEIPEQEEVKEVKPRQEYQRQKPKEYRQPWEENEEYKPTASKDKAPEPKPIFTFEDILQEIDRGKERVEKVKPEAKKQVQEKPEEGPMKAPKLTVEKMSKTDNLSEEYKKTHTQYKSLAEQGVTEGTPLVVSKQEKSLAYGNVLDMLKSPQGVKEAFILSEIFNRKYKD